MSLSQLLSKNFTTILGTATPKLRTSVDVTRIVEDKDKTGVIVTLKDERGGLKRLINLFDEYQLNLTHISSKPSQIMTKDKYVDFSIDFEGNQNDAAVNSVISELKKISSYFKVYETPQVPWFPMSYYELDSIGKTTLQVGDGLQMVDHPGFKDKEYRDRRLGYFYCFYFEFRKLK